MHVSLSPDPESSLTLTRLPGHPAADRNSGFGPLCATWGEGRGVSPRQDLAGGPAS